MALPYGFWLPPLSAGTPKKVASNFRNHFRLLPRYSPYGQGFWTSQTPPFIWLKL